MTWGEFKRQMDAAGVKDNEEIMYIDMGLQHQLDIEHELGMIRVF